MNIIRLFIAGEQDQDYNRVFLQAGQSNAQGWNSGTPAETWLQNPITGAQIFTGSAWDTLQFGVNNQGRDNSNHSVELNIAYTSVLNDPNNTTYIIKTTSNGGSYLAQREGESDWNANSTGELLDDFIEKINNGLPLISNYQIEGLIWLQGESDGLSQVTADAYYGNLIQMINKLRTQIGVDIPVLLIRPGSSTVTSYPYIETVRTAMLDVSNDIQLVKYLDTEDAAYTDGVHYTSSYFNLMAERCFNILK